MPSEASPTRWWQRHCRLTHLPSPELGCEALPADPLVVTKGHALVFTGDHVSHPGLGLRGMDDEELRADGRELDPQPGRARLIRHFRPDGYGIGAIAAGRDDERLRSRPPCPDNRSARAVPRQGEYVGQP